MYLLVNKKMILDLGELNQTFTKYGMAIPMSAHQVPAWIIKYIPFSDYRTHNFLGLGIKNTM